MVDKYDKAGEGEEPQEAIAELSPQRWSGMNFGIH